MQEENKKKFTEFGERLKSIRTRLKLNQQEFAVKLGFASYKAISRFENGERLPNAEALISLAALGTVNLHYLITGQPSPDGEAWRESWVELHRMYSADGTLWIDYLKGRIADLTKEINDLQEKESRGETINTLSLSLKIEERRDKQNKLDQVKDHLRQATDRLGGVRIEY
jgi:transcriptional regulator with XRE-family HTH domain